MASTISAGTTAGTAIAIAGDTTGNLAFQTSAGTYTQTMPNATGTVMVSGNMPAFWAYASGSQTISNTTWTKVTLGSEAFDTNSNFASSRFTPTVAGYYQINGVIRFNSTSSMTKVIVGIWKNGGEYYRPSEPAFTSGVMPQTQTGGGTIVYFNGSTDYVELYGYINGSGTLSFIDDGNQAYTSSMSGCLIRVA
jgi:hypothetical protein